MDDIQPCHPTSNAPRAEYSRLRDLLLALSVAVLLALTMQAYDRDGTPMPDGKITVQDWKGNSGSMGPGY